MSVSVRGRGEDKATGSHRSARVHAKIPVLPDSMVQLLRGKSKSRRRSVDTVKKCPRAQKTREQKAPAFHIEQRVVLCVPLLGTPLRMNALRSHSSLLFLNCKVTVPVRKHRSDLSRLDRGSRENILFCHTGSDQSNSLGFEGREQGGRHRAVSIHSLASLNGVRWLHDPARGPIEWYATADHQETRGGRTCHTAKQRSSADFCMHQN